MQFTIFEFTLIPLCFAILLVSTMLHWIKPVFSTFRPLDLVSKMSMLIANILLSLFLLERWVYIGHPPFSNLFESFLLLSWSFTSVHLMLQDRMQEPWLGLITAPSAMLTQAFAVFSLPLNMQKATALVPALQSNWLTMHVSMMILSYGGLLFGSLLAITYLSVNSNVRINLDDTNSKYNTSVGLVSNHPVVISTISKCTDTIHSLESLFFETRRMHLLDQLDYWSSRAIKIGFPFLTTGILSGAVWANETWGSYWSWDPKETWALITWLIFAVYLHLRMTKGWIGTKPALVASLGLFVVWACYLGVNLLGKGLHSYGWIN